MSIKIDILKITLILTLTFIQILTIQFMYILTPNIITERIIASNNYLLMDFEINF